MSQNNHTILYAGIDVAKATLELSLNGVSHSMANDSKGHARILKLLASAEASGVKTHVIIEATGGYEAALCAALHAAGKTLSVLQPARIRHFARAKNQHAKTDAIDAAVLATFGQAIKPSPATPPSAAQSRMSALVGRRAQLVESRTCESNRAAHYSEPMLCKQSRRMLKLLDIQIAECERAIAAQTQSDKDMAARAARMQQVPGIGPVVAAVLQAQMPELGTLEDGEAAALAGLAPYNSDSGPHQGARRIRGGRAPVRCALYMAAMNSVRFDPILRQFYQRLLGAGKVPKVALTAAMRKLLILLNRMLKKPNFMLQSAPESP
jgi:transposase